MLEKKPRSEETNAATDYLVAEYNSDDDTTSELTSNLGKSQHFKSGSLSSQAEKSPGKFPVN